MVLSSIRHTCGWPEVRKLFIEKVSGRRKATLQRCDGLQVAYYLIEAILKIIFIFRRYDGEIVLDVIRAL
ncbi:MAG: hypothetical protein LBH58_02835, partial [Tannerellaceae bacterium]|nr:hypothetical protein [Tannerellaceae bacterium]